MRGVSRHFVFCNLATTNGGADRESPPCNVPSCWYNVRMSTSTINTVPGYYTVEEAASFLEREVSTICRYIRQGLLPAHDLGHQWLILAADLHAFVPPLAGNPEFRK